MSAYENAVQAAMTAIYGVDTSSARIIATRAIAGFLAALPPSIVVDGKVVELGEAVNAFLNMPDARPGTMEWQLAPFLADLLDAAREVAE